MGRPIPADAPAVDERTSATRPPDAERVLFGRANSAFWSELTGVFREDFTYDHPRRRALACERGVRLVGIDYLSVEKFKSETFETHTTCSRAA